LASARNVHGFRRLGCLAIAGERRTHIVQGAALWRPVPPVFPSGTGTADLTYDPATRVVTWAVTYSGLSSPATMAHFHGPGQPGKNAPVVIWLTKQGSPVESPINGQATLTPDQARQFEASDWYINIHTQAHPDGEIRGLVLTPFPSHADDAHRARRSRRSKH
jgi:hypothetical protein